MKWLIALGVLLLTASACSASVSFWDNTAWSGTGTMSSTYSFPQLSFGWFFPFASWIGQSTVSYGPPLPDFGW